MKFGKKIVILMNVILKENDLWWRDTQNLLYGIVLNPHLLVQFLPSPEYPGLHAHVNDPTVSVQVASSWQLSLSRVHSSSSKKNGSS